MGDSKKVLIIEDEFYLAEIIRERLEYHGYEVETAENGPEGIKRLEKFSPHLILMDYVMPVMDGLETTRHIKSNPSHQSIPIVFLTVKSYHEDKKLAIDAGAADYMTKPFDFSQLMNTIQKWV